MMTMTVELALRMFRKNWQKVLVSYDQDCHSKLTPYWLLRAPDINYYHTKLWMCPIMLVAKSLFEGQSKSFQFCSFSPSLGSHIKKSYVIIIVLNVLVTYLTHDLTEESGSDLAILKRTTMMIQASPFNSEKVETHE